MAAADIAACGVDGDCAGRDVRRRGCAVAPVDGGRVVAGRVVAGWVAEKSDDAVEGSAHLGAAVRAANERGALAHDGREAGGERFAVAVVDRDMDGVSPRVRVGVREADDLEITGNLVGVGGDDARGARAAVSPVDGGGVVARLPGSRGAVAEGGQQHVGEERGRTDRRPFREQNLLGHVIEHRVLERDHSAGAQVSAAGDMRQGAGAQIDHAGTVECAVFPGEVVADVQVVWSGDDTGIQLDV